MNILTNTNDSLNKVDEVLFYENGKYYCIIEYGIFNFILGIGKTKQDALKKAEEVFSSISTRA